MPLRSWVKRLEHAARGDLGSFVLMDGSRYYFDPQSGECFLHWCACLTAGNPDKWPEPPETIKALTRARDRAGAFEQVCGGTFGTFPYEREALVERGELVPRSLVAGRDVHDQEVEDLSEP
jgi:hypothetical protein